MTEPDNLVLHLLREMREDVRQVNAKVDGLVERVDDLTSKVDGIGVELHSLRADVASDLLTLEKRLNEQNVSLRRAVMEYHSTAVGHGLLYSELEERVRRIEQRLEMTPSDPH
jgi:uncharacterized coiled-coil DUF342 family protein